jgi:WD40 repeat protein
MFENGSASVWAVAWSFDGYMLASGGDDMGILLWDARKGERLTEFKGHR